MSCWRRQGFVPDLGSLMLQAGTAVEDEVQNELMVAAIEEVGQVIAAQGPTPAPTAKSTAKAAPSKGKKDEPKPIQVSVTSALPVLLLKTVAKKNRTISRCKACACMSLPADIDKILHVSGAILVS